LADLNNEGSVDVIESLPEEEIRVCLFSIGEDAYAIPVELLAEIIIPQKVFPVPTTPSHVLGVINLRGNIVPIVDMRPALSLPQSSAAGQIAIIKYGALTVGIVVDNVSEGPRIPGEQHPKPLHNGDHTARDECGSTVEHRADS
jgi:purine-binding chemotaxis protein CheW